jgi:hypothetical protein
MRKDGASYKDILLGRPIEYAISGIGRPFRGQEGLGASSRNRGVSQVK